MEFKDYYRTLGVARDAPADAIKKAFRKLARKYHPDISKEPDAGKRMAEINEANTVLADPEKRAAYDQLGQHSPGQDFRPPPNPRSSASSSPRFSAGWAARVGRSQAMQRMRGATATTRASCSSSRTASAAPRASSPCAHRS